MTQIDFSTYKFRCSGLSNLLVQSRSTTEVLAETTKTYLRELWIKEVYGREKLDTKNKFTEKGILVESDSMDLIQSAAHMTFFKNSKKYENEWITGTPDIIAERQQFVVDVKSSWDIFTFAAVDYSKAKKDYYAQILGYMWLTGYQMGTLAYCLTNTPEEIISKELYRLSFNNAEIGQNDETDAFYRKHYIFDDIAPQQRVKMFKYLKDDEVIVKLKNKIELSREYMNGLSL